MRIRNLKYVWIFVLLATTSSCGEFFNIEMPVQADVEIELSHHDVDLLVGDTILLETTVEPDTVEVSYFWDVYGDADALEVIGHRIRGLKEGVSKVLVQVYNVAAGNEAESFADSCIIRTFEWNPIERDEYLYETVVYASLSYNGEDVTGSLGDLRIAAVVDGELRGEAVMRKAYGIPYLEMRIKSSWPGEVATIECYHTTLYKRFVLGQQLLDGETYGTLSALKEFSCREPNFEN